MTLRSCCLVLTVLLSSAAAHAQELLPPVLNITVTRGAVVGEEFEHTIAAGDTLASLAAEYGIDPKVITEENGLRAGARLEPGQSLRIPNRHIVPPGTYDGLIVNIPQRHLFLFREGSVERHYPVAVGRGDWRTPTGGFHIAVKEQNPSWEVPKSIQEEMRRSGKTVLTVVPPGPDNPLGEYWLGLNRSGVGIHGTNSPNSIYRAATHGCIRMRPGHIQELFGKVEVNTPVSLIYQPILFAIADDGVYLEAHPDVYKKGEDPIGVVQQLAAEAGVTDKVDWELVKQVLAKRQGIARRVNSTTVVSR